MSRRLLTFGAHHRPREKPEYIVERDRNRYVRTYGQRPDLDLVRSRMEQEGLSGDPFAAVMLCNRKQGGAYWLRVWAVRCDGRMRCRIYRRQGAAVYSPPWYVGTMIEDMNCR